MKYLVKLSIIIALILTACSKDEEKEYTIISFERATYNFEHENHTVEIPLSFSEAAPEAGTIALSFEGSAERLDDFKCPTQLNFRKGDLGSSFEFEILFNDNNPPPKSVIISMDVSGSFKTGEFAEISININ